MAESGVSGQTEVGGGDGDAFASGLQLDGMTGVMMNHFTREISKGGGSFWIQALESARKYFNVTQGYVLRKIIWQMFPFTPPKAKAEDGELGSEKDWTARVVEGIEAEIEEPDLYIPTMGFITYVLLCGLIQGLQEKFQPEVLSSTVTFAFAILMVELLVVKAVLVLAGAVHAPIMDVAALLAYKYLYLSAILMFGLLLGLGSNPHGFLYRVASLALLVSWGMALLRSMSHLTKMQLQFGFKDVNSKEVHQIVLKLLPLLQAVVCWILMPSWPKKKVVAIAASGLSAAASAAVG
eukprot:TRINITY_DN19503_c0_g1_i1.p1 TRINITY_DN19503_c0_g1~~TRINITY_DN19503_c0_g1_i1.p1  ORF type:complete len:294 (-),score=51.01 TRINITY_DN19503_c0_g1_i1:269-1150(-)